MSPKYEQEQLLPPLKSGVNKCARFYSITFCEGVVIGLVFESTSCAGLSAYSGHMIPGACWSKMSFSLQNNEKDEMPCSMLARPLHYLGSSAAFACDIAKQSVGSEISHQGSLKRLSMPRYLIVFSSLALARMLVCS